MKRLQKADDVSKKDFALGRRIYRARKRARITQQELADDLDISYQYVAAIETGRKVPTLKMLERIAKKIGVKASDLLPY